MFGAGCHRDTDSPNQALDAYFSRQAELLQEEDNMQEEEGDDIEGDGDNSDAYGFGFVGSSVEDLSEYGALEMSGWEQREQQEQEEQKECSESADSVCDRAICGEECGDGVCAKDVCGKDDGANGSQTEEVVASNFSEPSDISEVSEVPELANPLLLTHANLLQGSPMWAPNTANTLVETGLHLGSGNSGVARDARDWWPQWDETPQVDDGKPRLAESAEWAALEGFQALDLPLSFAAYYHNPNGGPAQNTGFCTQMAEEESFTWRPQTPEQPVVSMSECMLNESPITPFALSTLSLDANSVFSSVHSGHFVPAQMSPLSVERNEVADDLVGEWEKVGAGASVSEAPSGVSEAKAGVEGAPETKAEASGTAVEVPKRRKRRSSEWETVHDTPQPRKEKPLASRFQCQDKQNGKPKHDNQVKVTISPSSIQCLSLIIDYHGFTGRMTETIINDGITNLAYAPHDQEKQMARAQKLLHEGHRVANETKYIGCGSITSTRSRDSICLVSGVLQRQVYIRDISPIFDKVSLVAYVLSSRFDVNNPYEPQYYRYEVDNQGMLVKESKCGLCSFCDQVKFLPFKNSSYLSHLTLEHGVFANSYVIPEGLYYGEYKMNKSSDPAKCRIVKGVQCPACFQIVEVSCWRNKLNPLLSYFRHFKKHHLNLTKTFINSDIDPVGQKTCH